jgi:hypothetical protein
LLSKDDEGGESLREGRASQEDVTSSFQDGKLVSDGETGVEQGETGAGGVGDELDRYQRIGR